MNRPRDVIDVDELEENVSKRSKNAAHVAESSKDGVAPVATSPFRECERELVMRMRCYDLNLILLHGLDDVIDDDDGGGILPLTLVNGVAVGRQEPGYEAVIRRQWGRTKEPFNSRTLSRFLYEAGGRGTPMEPVFLNSTEIHVVCKSTMSGEDYSFVGHYTRFNHNLEIRASFEGQVLPNSMFLVGISSAFNQCDLDAKRIGGPVRRSLNNPRAYFSFPILEEEMNQVTNLEVGHAIASMAYAAAELGWEVRLLDASFGFEELKLLTGLIMESDLMNDVPVAALVVFLSQCIPTRGAVPFPTSLLRSTIKRTLGNGITWDGSPYLVRKVDMNLENHRRYLASLQERTDGDAKDHMLLRDMSPGLTVQDPACPSGATLWSAMRSRSSGTEVEFDGNYAVSALSFHRFLLRCCHVNFADVGGGTCFPHGVLPWFARVNLLIFVNRVSFFHPGLYCLVRSPKDIMSFKDSMKSYSYQWTPVTWPALFPPSDGLSTLNISFHLLEIGKSYEGAKTNQQHLLKASSFFVAMIAPKGKDLTRDLMQRYWEAGFLGELLIVEAQAQGISATIVPTEPYSFWAQVLHRGDGRIVSLYAIGKPKDPTKTSDVSCSYGHADALPEPQSSKNISSQYYDDIFSQLEDL